MNPERSTGGFSDQSEQLIERCGNANIAYEIGEECVIIQLPNGRQNRSLKITERTIGFLLAVPFEKYSYLGEYAAIVCYEDNTIEASFKAVSGLPLKLVSQAFGQPNNADDNDDDENILEATVTIDGGDFAPNCAITVGPCTDVLRQLFRSSLGRFGRHAISIQISGIPVSTHDMAVETLENLTNSLFFQVELARGITLSLRRDSQRRRKFIAHRQAANVIPIEFPRTEYDSGPITLYWYGRSSLGMPLLQFLAFYQCIEFYFPTCYQAEQKKRIRNILKSPTFRPDREADIGILLAVMGSSARKGFPDEKSMLCATLQECLDAAELRSYLEEDEDRKAFFSKAEKGITSVKIPVLNIDVDLRDHVAARIYDIRCRIVHTKAVIADSSQQLLPYSKEAQKLGKDIALLAFIARKVLIASSSTLQLPINMEN